MPSTQHKRTGKGHQDLRLHRALAAGEMALVKRLLTVADLEERNPADRGVQAIHVAAQHGHVEIIKLSSMYARARRRNKSFADRLGISDDIVSLTK